MKKRRGPKIFLVGSTWHFRYQRAGVRIQRSTGTSDRGRADQIAWADYLGEEMAPTLGEHAKKWLEVHEPVVSDAHWRHVRTFSKQYLYGLADLHLDRIRTEDVETARNLHAEGRAPASVNLWLRILKLLFNWAVKREVISHVPWQVKQLKLQKKPRATLPVSKIAEWLAAVDRIAGKRTGIATAIRMMVGVGLRESEALGSRWEWFDAARGFYTPGKTKGREAVPVPVPGWLVEHLALIRRPHGLIVESPRGGTYSPGSTRAMVLAANEACGTPGITPHRLRGTFATLLGSMGVPINDIQMALRHKDVKTTLGYCENDMGRVAIAQEEISRKMGMPRRENGDAGSFYEHQ